MVVRLPAGVVVVAIAATAASAGKRPRFEPTDLELEEGGTIELDLQAGPVRGPDALRVVAPDFELDVGILPQLELDLDGAFAREQGRTTRENMWASVKLGLFDRRDETGNAWAAGVQLGPKLPVADDAHGVGVEGLALIGRTQGALHVVAQVGGLIDPRSGTGPRPYGLEGGFDFQLDLDTRNRWALLGEAGAVWFGSPDADQLAFSLGLQLSPTSHLDLSVVALVGVLAGSDPYGLLIGASPKLGLW